MIFLTAPVGRATLAGMQPVIAIDETPVLPTPDPGKPGPFAVVCGPKLIGVHTSLEDALQAASEAFATKRIKSGLPILINELGPTPRLRAVAKPIAAE